MRNNATKGPNYISHMQRPRFKPWKRVRLPWERGRIEGELRYCAQNNGIFRFLLIGEYEETSQMRGVGAHKCR